MFYLVSQQANDQYIQESRGKVRAAGNSQDSRVSIQTELETIQKMMNRKEKLLLVLL